MKYGFFCMIIFSFACITVQEVGIDQQVGELYRSEQLRINHLKAKQPQFITFKAKDGRIFIHLVHDSQAEYQTWLSCHASNQQQPKVATLLNIYKFEQDVTYLLMVADKTAWEQILPRSLDTKDQVIKGNIKIKVNLQPDNELHYQTKDKVKGFYFGLNNLLVQLNCFIKNVCMSFKNRILNHYNKVTLINLVIQLNLGNAQVMPTEKPFIYQRTIEIFGISQRQRQRYLASKSMNETIGFVMQSLLLVAGGGFIFYMLVRPFRGNRQPEIQLMDQLVQHAAIIND